MLQHSEDNSSTSEECEKYENAQRHTGKFVVYLIDSFVYEGGSKQCPRMDISGIPSRNNILYYEAYGSNCEDVHQVIEKHGKNVNNINTITISHLEFYCEIDNSDTIYASKWTLKGLESLPNLNTIIIYVGAGLHNVCESLKTFASKITNIVLHDCYYLEHHEMTQIVDYCKKNNITLIQKRLIRNSSPYTINYSTCCTVTLESGDKDDDTLDCKYKYKLHSVHEYKV